MSQHARPRFVNTEAQRVTGERIRFSFGRNWRKYLRRLDPAKQRQARTSLIDSFAGLSLSSTRFLDLGCGSGLFSLAAIELGAGEVTSVDIDPESVRCAAELRARIGAPGHWNVRQGSLLDADFVGNLPEADRLYSWGVLHHTGDMWRALDLVLDRLAPNGVACIALYNRPGRPRLHFGLKRLYNRLPRPAAALLAAGYSAALLGGLLIQCRRNPISYVRGYSAEARGMTFWRDVEDWLGGLPFEWVEPETMEERVASLGYTVTRVIRRSPGANNEYLIRAA